MFASYRRSIFPAANTPAAPPLPVPVALPAVPLPARFLLPADTAVAPLALPALAALPGPGPYLLAAPALLAVLPPAYLPLSTLALALRGGSHTRLPPIEDLVTAALSLPPIFPGDAACPKSFRP